MNHSNMYAVGLALCTFANIASEEMSRDLANEIEKLLGSSNTYIRKKVWDIANLTRSSINNQQAALCALRVVKKVPDIADHFISKAKNLLTDRNHGVLLTAITLVTEMCTLEENTLNEFRSVSKFLRSPRWFPRLTLRRPSPFSSATSNLWSPLVTVRSMTFRGSQIHSCKSRSLDYCGFLGGVTPRPVKP